MILGMTILTLIHVLLSLVGIVSGIVVVFGLLTAKGWNGWNALFLAHEGGNKRNGIHVPSS